MRTGYSVNTVHCINFHIKRGNSGYSVVMVGSGQIAVCTLYIILVVGSSKATLCTVYTVLVVGSSKVTICTL